MSRIFGPVRQNGYVVRDIEAAMKHWIEVLGVGPWYYFENVPVEDFVHRGQPHHLEMSIALANSGDLQIELIQQRNDAPSLYREFLDAHGEGLQHVSIWTEDFDAEFARFEGLGYRVGHQGRIGANRFVYYDTEADHPATVMEMYDISGGPGDFFTQLREMAASWDGSDPIRRP